MVERMAWKQGWELACVRRRCDWHHTNGAKAWSMPTRKVLSLLSVEVRNAQQGIYRARPHRGEWIMALSRNKTYGFGSQKPPLSLPIVFLYKSYSECQYKVDGMTCCEKLI
eukprot:scaffold449_cov303-Pavlova_lutheri.AAC.1